MKVYQVLLIILLIWSILATSLAVNYYSLYSNALRNAESLEEKLKILKQEMGNLTEKYLFLSSKVIVVSLAIDYGNGTVQWFNNTIVPRGTTVLSLLVIFAKVEYKLYSYGAYVISINGISEKIIKPGKEGYSWLWYTYDKEKGKWIMGATAADKHELSNKEIILWKYTHWSF